MFLALLACAAEEAVGEKAGSGQDLTAVVITPDTYVVPVGETVQLAAIGLTADRETEDVTTVVTWESDDGDVARVSNDLDEEGLLSARGAGEAEIEACTADLCSNTVLVQVTEAELVGLAVEPDEIALAKGDTLQLEAVAAWSDGSRGDAARQVRWITGDGDVAQIESGGLLTAAGAGETEIYAQYGETRSEPVTVSVSGASSSGEPDLRVKEVEGVAGDGVITLDVTFENNGDASASAFWVDVFVNPGSEPDVGDTGDGYVYVSYLAAGDSETETFTIYGAQGSQTIWVLVDSTDAVEESKEGNNTLSATIDAGGDDGPNLEISYFDWLADDTYIYYAVDVTNSGSDDVGSFYIDLFVDRPDAPELYEDGDTYTTVDSLDAGDTAYADFLLEDWCWGCESWVLIDGYDYVAETDEDDNVAGPLSVYSETDTGW
jgi:hypothetical protein